MDITLEKIKSISHDILADLVYAQIDSNHVLYEKVEKTLLKSDPKALVKSIKKDIGSIRRGRKFIDYHEAFDFADKVQNIVDDILMMVDDEKVASTLIKELILTDSNVYLRSDDSAGVIQISYGNAEGAWTGYLGMLSDEEIYADIIEMLVCEGFGVRSVFSDKIPKNVLEKIYDEFYAKCEGRNGETYDNFDDIHVLHLCSHFLKKPELYIKASQFNGREIQESDFLDYAQEYKYAEDAQGVIDTLGQIKFVDEYKANNFYELQVWAYEVLKQSMNITLAYKNWYSKTKSPKVLKSYLSRLDGVMKKQVREEALSEAKKRSFSDAMQFFHSLDEAELASEYIWEHQQNLETQYMFADGLKKMTTWLQDGYPQEAILLYRDSCEKALKTSQSKYYPSAIKSLKQCVKLEASNDTLSWQIEDNLLYMEKLLDKHKRKPKFVQLFFKAFGEA